eukprot:sb/3467407/
MIRRRRVGRESSSPASYRIPLLIRPSPCPAMARSRSLITKSPRYKLNVLRASKLLIVLLEFCREKSSFFGTRKFFIEKRCLIPVRVTQNGGLAAFAKETSPAALYKEHEQRKKKSYMRRVQMVEGGSFTPLIMSTSGGLGEEFLKVETVQRKFTKRIEGMRDLNYWDRLKKLGILSLQRRRERYNIIMVWKMANGEAPNNIGIRFYQNQRLGKRAEVPTCPTNTQSSVASKFQNSFASRATRLWNTLPSDVNSAKDLAGFKILLGKWLKRMPDRPPGGVRQLSTLLFLREVNWTSGG